MIKMLKYLKPREWLFAFIGAVFIVIQVGVDLRIPDFMREITTLVQTEGSTMSEILQISLWMLLTVFAGMLVSIVVGFFAARVVTALEKELRRRVFEKTLSFSMQEINNFSTASLITRSTNDITQIQQVMGMSFRVMLRAPILAIWAILRILGKGWEWSLATGVAVTILLVMVGGIIIFAVPKFKIIQELIDNLNRVIREHLMGIRVVQAYNAEGFQGEKFDQANTKLMKTNLFINRTMAIVWPGIGLITTTLTLSIYWIGALLLNQADLADRIDIFSNMVVFSAYAMQVILAFMLLTMTFVMLPRALVSAKRVNEILETPLSLVDGELEVTPNQTKGEIEVRNISFKYPGAEGYVLKDISFKAKKGETVAFIGSTGSGKSTLVNLISRFYDVTAGDILVDGVNVKAYKQEALNKKIGYISQKAVLFSGTVTSNVAYGDPEQLTAASIQRAVEIAQGKEFVENMEGAYEAGIAQGGTNLSGGQKQRLSIARAVAKNPEIFIFDDSFSALDYKTDRALRRALKKELQGVTTLIVAQRIGTIKEADQIIVLDEGKMVGIGRHDELLRTCKTYQEIAYSQLSKEELANA